MLSKATLLDTIKTLFCCHLLLYPWTAATISLSSGISFVSKYYIVLSSHDRIINDRLINKRLYDFIFYLNVTIWWWFIVNDFRLVRQNISSLPVPIYYIFGHISPRFCNLVDLK